MPKSSQYRLAIRSTENMVMAYFAEVGTMEHAVLIGTMPRGVAEMWPDTFDAFKTTMSIIIVHMCAAQGEQVSELIERDPPPSEKPPAPV